MTIAERVDIVWTVNVNSVKPWSGWVGRALTSHVSLDASAVLQAANKPPATRWRIQLSFPALSRFTCRTADGLKVSLESHSSSIWWRDDQDQDHLVNDKGGPDFGNAEALRVADLPTQAMRAVAEDGNLPSRGVSV